MKTILNLLLVAALLNACSTAGGMYDKDDPANNQFSAWKTIGLPFAVVGLAVVGAAAGYAAAENARPTYVYTPTRSLNCTSTRSATTTYTNCY